MNRRDLLKAAAGAVVALMGVGATRPRGFAWKDNQWPPEPIHTGASVNQLGYIPEGWKRLPHEGLQAAVQKRLGPGKTLIVPADWTPSEPTEFWIDASGEPHTNLPIMTAKPIEWAT